MKALFVLVLVAGFGIGVAASTLLRRAPASTDALAALHEAAIETGISVLDSLEAGDEETARLLLASSVNSHIVMWEKMDFTDGKKSNMSEAWRRQMSMYNAQSGLSLPAESQQEAR